MSASRWGRCRSTATDVAVIALALCLAACNGEAARRRQGEAVRVAQQIDRLRDADNAHKRAELGTLVALPCGEAALCKLQELCVHAYSLHQEALDEIAALKAMTEPGAAVPAAVGKDASTRLDVTQQKLERALADTERCAQEQVVVVRRFLL
ncbi:MAG: hypothetical protein ABW217_16705 [Polyangiaceae bacterium]